MPQTFVSVMKTICFMPELLYNWQAYYRNSNMRRELQEKRIAERKEILLVSSDGRKSSGSEKGLRTAAANKYKCVFM